MYWDTILEGRSLVVLVDTVISTIETRVSKVLGHLSLDITSAGNSGGNFSLNNLIFGEVRSLFNSKARVSKSLSKVK